MLVKSVIFLQLEQRDWGRAREATGTDERQLDRGDRSDLTTQGEPKIFVGGGEPRGWRSGFPEPSWSLPRGLPSGLAVCFSAIHEEFRLWTRAVGCDRGGEQQDCERSERSDAITSYPARSGRGCCVVQSL